MDSATLYQRVLGKEFYRLPANLQRFHSLPSGGCATGVVEVKSGSGVLRHAAARVLRLPRSDRSIPLRLQVIPEGEKEIWIRDFGGQVLTTTQWQEGPYLVEKVGPLHLVFQLVAEKDGMTFHWQYNRLSGLQLPKNIAVRVQAAALSTSVGSETATVAPDGWNIKVAIGVPLLGTITTYRGEIIAQPC